MNLRILSLGEMITLLRAWLEPQLALFKSVTEIAGLLPQLEKAFRDALQYKQASESQALAESLTAKIREIDARHDGMIRTVWYGIEANICCMNAEDPPRSEEARQLMALRSELIPEGLSTVNKAYLEEAGVAEQVLRQLTPEQEAMLKSVPLMAERSALDAVRAWGELGIRLGGLERERSLAQAKSKSDASEFDVRVAWVNIVGMTLDVMKVSTAPKEVLTALRQPIEDAVDAAIKRDAERKATAKKAADAKAAAEKEAAAGSTSAPAGAETGAVAAPASAASPASSSSASPPASAASPASSSSASPPASAVTTLTGAPPVEASA